MSDIPFCNLNLFVHPLNTIVRRSLSLSETRRGWSFKLTPFPSLRENLPTCISCLPIQRPFNS